MITDKWQHVATGKFKTNSGTGTQQPTFIIFIALFGNAMKDVFLRSENLSNLSKFGNEAAVVPKVQDQDQEVSVALLMLCIKRKTHLTWECVPQFGQELEIYLDPCISNLAIIHLKI